MHVPWLCHLFFFLSFFFVQVNVCVIVSGVGSCGSIEHELRIKHLLARAQRVNQPRAGVYNPVSQSSALFLSLPLSFYPAIIWTSNMYINRSQPHENMFHCPTSRQEHVSLICSICSFNHSLGLFTDTDHLAVHFMNETSTLTQGSIRKLKPNTGSFTPCPSPAHSEISLV